MRNKTHPCVLTARVVRFLCYGHSELDGTRCVNKIEEYELPTEPIRRKRFFNKHLWSVMEHPEVHDVDVVFMA